MNAVNKSGRLDRAVQVPSTAMSDVRIVTARTIQSTTASKSTSAPISTTTPCFAWSWRLTHPSGSSRPASRSRFSALGPCPCSTPTCAALDRPVVCAGIQVPIATAGPRPENHAASPLLAGTCAACSSVSAGPILTHPSAPGAAAISAMAETTAERSSRPKEICLTGSIDTIATVPRWRGGDLYHEPASGKTPL